MCGELFIDWHNWTSCGELLLFIDIIIGVELDNSNEQNKNQLLQWECQSLVFHCFFYTCRLAPNFKLMGNHRNGSMNFLINWFDFLARLAISIIRIYILKFVCLFCYTKRRWFSSSFSLWRKKGNFLSSTVNAEQHWV